MVTIKSDYKRLIRDLKRVEGGMQQTTAAMLNIISTGAASAQARNIRTKMIVRGAYTERSLVHYKASASKPIDRQNAIVGTKSPYLPVQDSGGKVKAKKKYIAVPTNKVRGKDRKKRIPARYRIDQPGSKVFMLKPARPTKTLKRAALFIRRGKKIEKIRDIGARDYTLKARRWHRDAVEKFGSAAMRKAVFYREGRKMLERIAAGGK